MEGLGVPDTAKDRVIMIFLEWLAVFENQKDRKLKCLQSDNGVEYKLDEFFTFRRQRGMTREFMTSLSPEQNGIAERMNRTIQERIVTMLKHSRLQ